MSYLAATEIVSDTAVVSGIIRVQGSLYSNELVDGFYATEKAVTLRCFSMHKPNTEFSVSKERSQYLIQGI
jgi:hypothetical protein